jgi:hypothetical protein
LDTKWIGAIPSLQNHAKTNSVPNLRGLPNLECFYRGTKLSVPNLKDFYRGTKLFWISIPTENKRTQQMELSKKILPQSFEVWQTSNIFFGTLQK